MKFQFKIQQYQTEAVEDTVNVFRGQPSHYPTRYRRDVAKIVVKHITTALPGTYDVDAEEDYPD